MSLESKVPSFGKRTNWRGGRKPERSFPSKASGLRRGDLNGRSTFHAQCRHDRVKYESKKIK